MPIRLDDLGPEARKQARAQLRKQGQAPEPKQNKYRNIPDERTTAQGNVIRFASRAEARRYDELMALLKAGQIRDLKIQPEFELLGGYIGPDGYRHRGLHYRADFSYERLDGMATGAERWVYVVEDVKSPVTKTRVYAIKKRLMEERLGITITEVS